jgi:hypothetical protein
VTDARKTGEQRILAILQSAWPNEVPAPTLANISLQYSSRIHGLRKKGWIICNRLAIVNGTKHGFFRLGPRPVPSGAELRRGLRINNMLSRHQLGATVTYRAAGPSTPTPPPTPPPAGTGSLFGDISPDRTYRE